MTASQIFSLISEIFSLAGRLDSGATETARGYILEHFKGTAQEGLLMTLDGLEHLRGKSEPAEAPGHPIESPRERSPVSGSVETLTREFKAMLLDPTFIPTKAEAQIFLKKLFGDSIAMRVSSKDSRQDLVERAIRTFRDLGEDERRQVFQYVRSAYLRGRHSSLDKWSDIITKGE